MKKNVLLSIVILFLFIVVFVLSATIKNDVCYVEKESASVSFNHAFEIGKGDYLIHYSFSPKDGVNISYTLFSDTLFTARYERKCVNGHAAEKIGYDKFIFGGINIYAKPEYSA